MNFGVFGVAQKYIFLETGFNALPIFYQQIVVEKPDIQRYYLFSGAPALTFTYRLIPFPSLARYNFINAGFKIIEPAKKQPTLIF